MQNEAVVYPNQKPSTNMAACLQGLKHDDRDGDFGKKDRHASVRKLENSIWAENKCNRAIISDSPINLEHISPRSYILCFDALPIFDDYDKHKTGLATGLLHEIQTEKMMVIIFDK